MPSLDTFQQVFSLSMALDKATATKGALPDVQKSLEEKVKEQIQQLGEGWELVWGPVAWKANPDDPATPFDNACFVARHPGCAFHDMRLHRSLVIAVTGTTYAASRDWLNKQSAVHTVVDFDEWVLHGVGNAPMDAPQVVPGGTYVSSGIANGVHTIMNAPAPNGKEEETLLDFLAREWRSSRYSKIVFTGFSLGGALAPTLALAFLNWDHLPRSIRPLVDAVHVYPIAGPSPGNSAFTKRFAAMFPDCTHYAQRGAPQPESSDSLTISNAYQAWNCNIINPLDVVPQAWSTSIDESPSLNLKNIPAIYGKPTLPHIEMAAHLLNLPPLLSETTYAPLPTKLLSNASSDVAPKNAHEWVQEAWRQHDVNQYVHLFGLSTTLEVEPPEVIRENMFGHPVIGAITWVVDHPEEMKASVPGARERANAKVEEVLSKE